MTHFPSYANILSMDREEYENLVQIYYEDEQYLRYLWQTYGQYLES